MAFVRPDQVDHGLVQRASSYHDISCQLVGVDFLPLPNEVE